MYVCPCACDSNTSRVGIEPVVKGETTTHCAYGHQIDFDVTCTDPLVTRTRYLINFIYSTILYVKEFVCFLVA